MFPLARLATGLDLPNTIARMTVPVDVALTELELAEQFRNALDRRDIPEKFFYWFPLSVRAWLALCGAGEYRNYSRSRGVVARSAAELARLAPAGRVEVVSLGAGQGDKDLLLLDALRAAGRDPFYRPVDTSLALLELAVTGATASGHAARGLKADFTEPLPLDLPDAGRSAASDPPSRAGQPTRLWLMLGNTLGAFDPPVLARRLAGRMRGGEVAVVDAELFAGADTLAGYDNPVNRRFAFAPLAGAGLTEADGELVFDLEEDARMVGLHRVVKSFTAARAAVLHVAGERLPLGAGDVIRMSPSHKYEERTFLELLSAADLDIVQVFRSPDTRFLMAAVRAR